MIWRSDLASSPRSGFTLLEALVTLAILSVLLAVSASALRGPSPALSLHRTGADWSVRIAEARARAVANGQGVDLVLDGAACDTAQAVLRLHPDGTVTGPDLCLTEGGAALRLRASVLTGHLARVDP